MLASPALLSQGRCECRDIRAAWSGTEQQLDQSLAQLHEDHSAELHCSGPWPMPADMQSAVLCRRARPGQGRHQPGCAAEARAGPGKAGTDDGIWPATGPGSGPPPPEGLACKPGPGRLLGGPNFEGGHRRPRPHSHPPRQPTPGRSNSEVWGCQWPGPGAKWAIRDSESFVLLGSATHLDRVTSRLQLGKLARCLGLRFA